MPTPIWTTAEDGAALQAFAASVNVAVPEPPAVGARIVAARLLKRRRRTA